MKKTIFKHVLSATAVMGFIFIAFGSGEDESKTTSNDSENVEVVITADDIPGTYNNFEINNQLRLKADGTLEFYTATSMTPQIGYWKLTKNKITIGIPTWITSELIFKVTKQGLENDKGKLVWKKV